MTIDFTCQKCESSFELDAQDLIDGTEKLVCPHCDSKAPPGLSEDFVSALTEMRVQTALLSKKFSVALAIETEDVEEEVDDDEDLEDEEDIEEDEDEDVEDEEDYDEDKGRGDV